MSSVLSCFWWAQRLRTSDTSNTSERTAAGNPWPNTSFQVAFMPLNRNATSPVDGSDSGLWSREFTRCSQSSP